MTDMKFWLEQLVRGRISRREFMGRAAALSAGTALAATLGSRAASAQTPKQGGFARFGLAHGATTDTLDPGQYLDTFPQTAFSGALSNALTEVDAQGNIVGDLAESFAPADDPTTWIFRLRPGLTFHDGRPVTANDVVESYRHHMGEASTSAVKSLLDEVEDIRADDELTVTFVLKGGNADFPYLSSDYHLVIMPAKEGGGVDWESGIRTGPFILEAFEPGIRAKLRRNPNYHKEGKPYFDEVEFLALTDVAARTNALTTGEVHYIGRPDLKTLSLLQRNPEIEIDELTGFGHYTLPMDVTVAPFNDPNVRMALKYAIDREDIVEKVFLGHATPGNDNPIAPSIPYAIDPEPRHTYDPQKAREYLQAAGLSELTVDLSVSDAAFAGAVDAAALIKEHAAAAGITVNIIREPADGYWDNVWLKKPWVASYWGGRATPDWMFTTAYAGDAAWNETHWNNPRFDELLLQARAETDEARRAEMYAEMQQLVHDDGGAIVLVFNNIVAAHSKALAHGDIAANWENDGLRIAERWWFA